MYAVSSSHHWCVAMRLGKLDQLDNQIIQRRNGEVACIFEHPTPCGINYVS